MVLFPVILVLMFGAVQTAMHYHARNVAQAAASEAVVAGSTTAGSPAAAAAAAQGFIDTAGDGVLVDAGVDVQRSGSAITVTVTGHSLNILPGIGTPLIRQTVSGTVERTG